MKQFTLALLSTLLFMSSCVAGTFIANIQHSQKLLNNQNFTKNINNKKDIDLSGVIIHINWWGFRLGFTHEKYLQGLNVCIKEADLKLIIEFSITGLMMVPTVDAAITLIFKAFSLYYTNEFNIVGLNFIWPSVPIAIFWEHKI